MPTTMMNESKNRPKAFMLVGVPGSGKSTYFEKYLARQNAVLVSTDAYIESVAAMMGKTYGDIFKETYGEAAKWMAKQLDDAIAAQATIAWDQTNLTIKSRRPKIDKLTSLGYDVIAVVFEIPDEELARRRKERAERTGKDIPASVLESMGATFQKPTRLEGLVQVIVVDGQGNETVAE